MFYLFGIAISLIGVVFSISHLQQSAEVYGDLVAVVVVIGGTLAVAIMTLPWEFRGEIGMRVRELLRGRSRNLRQLVMSSMAIIRSRHSGSARANVDYPGPAGEILRDGVELIELGLETKKIQLVLEERVHQSFEDTLRIANAFRALAKYPPAFGLIGTVLSLVSVMRAVASGASPQDTGSRMAVALVATLYGLLLSNLFVAPAGESILKSAQEDRKEADLALQAILLASDRVSILESQEMLNSFVPRVHRVSLVMPSDASDTAESATNASAA